MRQFYCDDDGVGMVRIYNDGDEWCNGTEFSITVAQHMDQTDARAVCTGFSNLLTLCFWCTILVTPWCAFSVEPPVIIPRSVDM